MSSRTSQEHHPVYAFDDFQLDPSKRILLQANRPISLTPRVFDALSYLVQNHGRVVSKQELIDTVWPDSFVEENNLSQSISLIRRVLGERKGENRYIVTVAGHGYRFAAPVRVVESPDTIGMKSIAVLPFKPLVEKDRDEALELGMADALIIRLSNSRELVVRPLSSVRRYTGLDQDAQRAGSELGVASVLDGSIQRSADRIRVTARLTSVADGSSLWVGKFDENFTDVFSVQDSISQRVAVALKLGLSNDVLRGPGKRYTDSTRAYELYLQGRYHWSKLIPAEVRKAIGFYQDAISVDPNYALAYLGLAVAHVSLPISSEAQPQHAFPEARAAALKALELDETLADAQAYLGFVKSWFDWDWSSAEDEFKRGLEINPNSSELHRGYGILLSQLGRHAEAIAEGTRARELDPLSLITRINESLFFYFAGRYAEAEQKINNTLELEPNFWIALLTRAKISFQLGRTEEAIKDLLKARSVSGGSSQPISLLGYISAVKGDRAQTMTLIEELRRVAQTRYVPPYNFALLYNGLKDDEQTFAWLQRAFEVRDVLLAAFITTEPFWDRLRNQKRFRDLLGGMKFNLLDKTNRNCP